MNSIELKYANFDPDWVFLKRGDKTSVVKMTVLYLMRAVTSQVFSDHVREVTSWSGAKMVEFRNNLKFAGYLQRELKFYIYASVVDTTYGMTSVLKEDKQFIARMLATDDKFSKALKDQCKAYYKLGYVPRVLGVFSMKCDRLVEDLDLYCKKFVIKCLDFVVKQNSMTIQDMVNELMSYGIYAIFRAYPEVKNDMHMLNIAKQAAHNRGENIIKEAGAQSRSRLTRNDDGTFSARVISLHSKSLSTDYSSVALGPITNGMLVCSSLMVGLDGTSVENERADDVNRLRDLKATVRQIDENCSSAKAKKFLELLMGVYDPEFSAYLTQDNDEVFDTITRQEYAEKVRTYLGVSVEKARTFVRGLKAELVDFRN
jgi:hypothetical protein